MKNEPAQWPQPCGAVCACGQSTLVVLKQSLYTTPAMAKDSTSPPDQISRYPGIHECAYPYGKPFA